MPDVTASAVGIYPNWPATDHFAASEKPVRIGCDFALHVPCFGVFLAGWRIDPKGMITRITLHGANGLAVRLDSSLVQVTRPEIGEAWRDDPLFAGVPPWRDTLPGFMAFVPHTTGVVPEGRYALEFGLIDGTSMTLPLVMDIRDTDAALVDLLKDLSIDDPEFDRLVADHLAPLLEAVTSVPQQPAQTGSTRTFGPALRETPAVSVIVPLMDGWGEFDVNLALLAGDGDLDRAELIVVADRTSAEPVNARLRSCADFYGISVRLVCAAPLPDAHTALTSGVDAATGERLLLLAPTVFPRRKGWLGRLLAEHERLPPNTALSPTLIYEDRSIRFAGCDGPPAGGHGASAGGFTGYGEGWLAATDTTNVWMGTLECCLLRRELFEQAGGLTSAYAGFSLQSLDFALRLKACGGQFCWMPTEAMWAFDGSVRPDGDRAAQVRRHIDAHRFECRWGAVLALHRAGEGERR